MRELLRVFAGAPSATLVLVRPSIVVAWIALLVAAPHVARAGSAKATAKPAAAAAPPRWQTLPLPPAMPAAAATGFVESDGAKIFYARYGATNPKSDPVILLHGGMGNGDHWSHQVLALVDAKLDVIAIDSRGQGRSTRPKTKTKPTYDALATDVLAVMDHLAIERASLVGWSDGGEIAMKLAIHHPKRVAKLVVLGANYDAKGNKPRSKTPAKTFTAYSAKCRADYAKLSKTPKGYGAVSAWLSPIWREPMGFTKDQLKSIKAPTLIADGDHDEIIKLDQVKEMATLIPNARLEVFRDASHFVLWQDPASLNVALVDFLTQSAR
jgi:pimeloyl-ACP methyl ester carboxylesterase